MKKLTLTLGVVAVASLAQAAAIKWNTGALYEPTDIENKDGSIGFESGGKWTFNDKLTSSSGYTYTYYLVESLSEISYSAGDFYAWHEKGATGTFKGLTVIKGSANATASAVTAGVSGTDHYVDGESTTVYGSILLVASDKSGDVMYMENSASKIAGKSAQNVGNLANYIGAAKANGYMEWTAVEAVPEPFSGTLALLGMGAIALRRKMKKAKKA